MCKDMLDKPVYALDYAAQTQAEQDNARKPLTDEERAVYTKLTRAWQMLPSLGDEDILDVLVEKGWASYHRAWNPDDSLTWQYQRTHSMDDWEEQQ